MGYVTKKNRSKNSQLHSNNIYVLDASAIYNGVLTHNISGVKYIPQCVLEEVRGMMRGEALIEEALLYEELQTIVNRLQSDEIGLDTLSKEVKRAALLVNICKEKLRKIESEIEDSLK